MNKQRQDSAILLRTYQLHETSLLTHWMTREEGIVKAAANGAKRPKSPLAGSLDLFVSARIRWVASARSDLASLQSVEILSYREALRGHYDRLVAASYFTALLSHSLEVSQPAYDCYDLLERALDYLLEHRAGPKEIRFFERELSRHLGYSTRPEEVQKLYQNHHRLLELRTRAIA